MIITVLPCHALLNVFLSSASLADSSLDAQVMLLHRPPDKSSFFFPISLLFLNLFCSRNSFISAERSGGHYCLISSVFSPSSFCTLSVQGSCIPLPPVFSGNSDKTTSLSSPLKSFALLKMNLYMQLHALVPDSDWHHCSVWRGTCAFSVLFFQHETLGGALFSSNFQVLQVRKMVEGEGRSFTSPLWCSNPNLN